MLYSDGDGGIFSQTGWGDGGSTPIPAGPIFRGQHDPEDAPGPEPDPVNFVDASITTFTSPAGTELAPLGSGRWICVDAAASGGGDGKSWATAFNTIGAAENIATTPGDVVVIKGGTYREAIHAANAGTEAAPIRFTRYGTDRVRITGGEVLTGWTACTNQADALGSPQWANCYKAFIPAGDVMGSTGDAQAEINGILLGLMQDQVKLRLAIEAPGFTDAGLTTAEKQDRAYNRKNSFWYYPRVYTDPWAPVSDDDDEVYITNSTALGSRTASELTHAYLCSHFNDGNNVRIMKVKSFNESTDTATCAWLYKANSDYDGSIAVLNAGSDLTLPGFWVFSDTLEGDGTRKVVVYPYDGVDLTSAGTIEYCKRGHAITPGDTKWITVYGIDADSMAATSGTTGNAFGTGLTGWTGIVKTGWHFEECSAVNGSSESGWGAGFSVGSKADRCKIINCVVREVEGDGIVVIGGPENKTKSIIHQCEVSRSFGSSIRPHSFRQGIVSYNHIYDVVSSHANGMSVYGSNGVVGGDEILVYGNVIRTGAGIGLTYQFTTNLWLICNDVQTVASDTNWRGIEGNSTMPAYDPDASGYITDGIIVAMNNTCGPLKVNNGNTLGITSFKGGGSRHVNLNNVAHGIYDPMLWNRSGYTWTPTGSAPRWLEFSNNVHTSDTALGTDFLLGRSYTSGTAPNYYDQYPAMDGNVKNTTLSEVYTDVASANYRPVADGPLDGTGLPPANSVNSAILFPDVTDWGFAAFDFDRDCDGNALDWDNPPIGAYVVTGT